jgi:hypothetical protein
VVAPISLPGDVIEWLTTVFRGCNDSITRKQALIPTARESDLAFALIAHLAAIAVPMRLPSEWMVRLDTHYLGGGRHWGSWEIADIGIIVMFRRAGRLVRSKVALLQAKRLYPIEQDFEEDKPIDYRRGFSRLFEEDEEWLAVTGSRTFTFRRTSRYKALVIGDTQYRAIDEYEKQHAIPIYYMLYNPPRLPYAVDLPLVGTRPHYRLNRIGTRVIPATVLRRTLKKHADGYAPCYGDIAYALPEPFDHADHTAGWRLEHFVARLLVHCQEGYRAQKRDDEGLGAVFNERSGPISAAIGITFDAPE